MQSRSPSIGASARDTNRSLVLCPRNSEDGKCDAFGTYAPHDILFTGKVDHRKPVDGDHGIVYEPKE